MNSWSCGAHFAALYAPICGTSIASFPSAMPFHNPPQTGTMAPCGASEIPPRIPNSQVPEGQNSRQNVCPKSKPGRKRKSVAHPGSLSHQLHLRKERIRYREGIQAMEILRSKIPGVPPNKSLSKIQTLRLAKAYIKHLQSLLNDPGSEAEKTFQLEVFSELHHKNQYTLPMDQAPNMVCRSSSRNSSEKNHIQPNSATSVKQQSSTPVVSPDSTQSPQNGFAETVPEKSHPSVQDLTASLMSVPLVFSGSSAYGSMPQQAFSYMQQQSAHQNMFPYFL